MKNYDGGTAFPVFPETANGHGSAFRGMTLRDYFAAKAMQSIIAINGRNISPQATAGQAYEAADAMLKAREVQR
jgi:hypothetical protein